MADEVLKIRVDVETAKVGQIKDAIKSLNKEINTAAREELPALISQKRQLNETLNQLVPKNESFTQTIKAARQETRMFRFALLEMVHGVDGLGEAFSAVTGMSETSTAALKNWTTAAQNGLASGMGLKFGLEAIGQEALAGPIGLAVGIITTLGGALSAAHKAAEATAKDIDNLIEKRHKLLVELGDIGGEGDIAFQTEKLALANRHLTEALKPEIDVWASLTAGFTMYKDKTKDVAAAELEIDEARKTMTDTFKTQNKEILKGLEDQSKEEEHLERIRTEATKQRLKDMDALAKAMAKANKERQDFMNSARPVRVHEVGAAMEGKSFEDIMGGWMNSIGILQTGFAAVGNEIQRSIINMFGEAHSVFQVFLQGVLQGIAAIATQLASSAIISGIFSLFGFGLFGDIFSGLTGGAFASGGTLNEPVFGIGASGRAYAFGENGPERFSPLTSSGSSGSQSMQIYGETHLKNEHIVIAWKNGRTRDRMRGANY